MQNQKRNRLALFAAGAAAIGGLIWAMTRKAKAAPPIPPPAVPPIEYATADVSVAGYPETVMLEGALVEIIGVGSGVTRYGYGGVWEPSPGCIVANVPPGDHEVRVSATGYQSWSGIIGFAPGEVRTFFIRVFR